MSPPIKGLSLFQYILKNKLSAIIYVRTEKSILSIVSIETSIHVGSSLCHMFVRVDYA